MTKIWYALAYVFVGLAFMLEAFYFVLAPLLDAIAALVRWVRFGPNADEVVESRVREVLGANGTPVLLDDEFRKDRTLVRYTLFGAEHGKWRWVNGVREAQMF